MGESFEDENEGEISVPDSWSWVDQGGVSSVKNQVFDIIVEALSISLSKGRLCGSCSAFAVIAVIETCFWQETGTMLDLSEQHMLDCAYGHELGIFHNQGCYGGWPQVYLDMLINNPITGRTKYELTIPYKERFDSCPWTSLGNYEGAHVTGSTSKFNATEDKLKQEVFKRPVTTTMSVCT